MGEVEVNLKIFIKENGELRVTATASKYEQPYWTSISIADDDADKAVLGNKKLIKDIKRMCKVG